MLNIQTLFCLCKLEYYVSSLTYYWRNRLDGQNLRNLNSEVLVTLVYVLEHFQETNK